jgi:hypothetical protein
MSSASGHGQSTGLPTQSNVAGQRYCEHGTEKERMALSVWQNEKAHIIPTTLEMCSPLRCAGVVLLLLALLLLEHPIEELKLG